MFICNTTRGGEQRQRRIHYPHNILLFLLLHTCLYTGVLSASHGKLSYCNVDGNFGCSSWTQGDRLRCADSNPGVMDWAERPVRTDVYKLMTSTTGSVYIPGQYVELALSVNRYACNDDEICYDDGWTYRGLLIYAEDADGMRRGRFIFPTESHTSSLFHEPPQCSGALTHVNAEPKPLRVRLIYETPDEAGIGPLTFRALVKRGPANDGAFYFPNAAGDLVLDEAGSSGAAQMRQLGSSTEACSEICAEAGLLCRDATDAVPSGVADTLAGFASVAIACPTPLFLDCGATSPRATYLDSSATTIDFCTYRDVARCGLSTDALFDCWTRLSDTSATASRRLCPCVRPARRLGSADSTRTLVVELKDEDETVAYTADDFVTVTSAAARPSTPLLLVLFLLPFLQLFSHVGSHNWYEIVSAYFLQLENVSFAQSVRSLSAHHTAPHAHHKGS